MKEPPVAPEADGAIVGSEARVGDYHEDDEPMLRTVISYRYHVGGGEFRARARAWRLLRRVTRRTLPSAVRVFPASSVPPVTPRAA